MSGSIVNVLTPNGRRQNVKVQPNTAILKVLEEVCEKYKFDANEYDLKHHKRVLDLTTSFRFSGLPNNAQLEMVEAQKKRQDVDVELLVQLGDGTRLDGKFKPNTTLLAIIQQLCASELTGDDLFIIYMRTEIAHDKLADTTLKDLGLISGRAIVRVVHRDPNAAKINANVALNLQSTTKASEEEEQNRESKIRKTDESTASTSRGFVEVIKQEKAKAKESDETAMNESNEEQKSSEKELERIVEGIEQNRPNVEQRLNQVDVEKMVTSSPETTTQESDDDTGEIHILGERSAVLFTQNAAKAANLNDLPDSFFDLNVNDLKLLLKGLRTETQGTVEQPLMTSKLRQMEDDQKQLAMLNRYKTVIIRIQFPNRYVLQGTFTPYETIDKVIEFVRSYLANPQIDFYLFTTPPKSILPKESRLFEVNCVPSAILHFGSEEKQNNYLKEDILTKVSSPKASLMQALSDRGMTHTASDPVEEEAKSTPSASTSQQFRKPATSSAAFPTTSGETKLPKWLKPIGK